MIRALLVCVFLLVQAVYGIQLIPTTSPDVTAVASGGDTEGIIAGTDGWNSGGWGVNYITFNLGTSYFISSISLTTMQTGTDHTITTVYGSMEPGIMNSWYKLVEFDNVTSPNQVLSATFRYNQIKYLTILTSLNNDWVAWNNITVFGDKSTNKPLQLIPTRDLQVSGRASSSVSTDRTPDDLISGTAPWNSGNWGVNWIQINLGAPYYLTSISLTTSQTVTNPTTHIVYGSLFNQAEPTVLAVFNGITRNKQVLSATIPETKVQYVKIYTNRSEDWVAWNAMTLFGFPTVPLN